MFTKWQDLNNRLVVNVKAILTGSVPAGTVSEPALAPTVVEDSPSTAASAVPKTKKKFAKKAKS